MIIFKGKMYGTLHNLVAPEESSEQCSDGYR